MAVEANAGLPEVTFVPEQCLFCNMMSPDFDTNLTHMHKSHGLFIPLEIDDGVLVLVVDLKTLVQYLHLVIFEYHECLLCHTGRQTKQAVQQHMMGKGHCRIDLDGEESEFRDFYEEVDDGSAESESALDEAETSASDDETTRETTTDKPKGRQPSPGLDDKSLWLSSGKTLSHRSAPLPRYHRPLAETQRVARRGADHKLPASAAAPRAMDKAQDPTDDDAPDPAQEEGSRTLTRLERRAETNNRSTLSHALARLSANDRAALGHLPVVEQRAMVLRQFKQQDKAGSREHRYWGESTCMQTQIDTDREVEEDSWLTIVTSNLGKMGRKNNSLLMEHFVSDVPGRRLG